MICWKCRKEIAIEKPVRGDECPFCHADLHVCKACDFYENGAHNDCRESSAELMVEKERSNFCDYFRVSKKLVLLDGEASAGNSKAEQAKNAAAALFGETPSGETSSKSAKDAFNALFG